MSGGPTKAEAEAAGLTQFWSDTPCLRGHMGWRYAGNGGCVECRRANNAARVASGAAAGPTAEYRAKNPGRGVEANRAYRQTPRGRAIWDTNDALRRAGVRQAAAICTAEDKQLIVGLFAEVRLLTDDTGEKHHLDHCVPLRCKDPATGERIASGLHHPTNLRPLPGKANLSRGCRVSAAEMASIDGEIFADLIARGLARRPEGGLPLLRPSREFRLISNGYEAPSDAATGGAPEALPAPARKLLQLEEALAS